MRVSPTPSSYRPDAWVINDARVSGWRRLSAKPSAETRPCTGRFAVQRDRREKRVSEDFGAEQERKKDQDEAWTEPPKEQPRKDLATCQTLEADGAAQERHASADR